MSNEKHREAILAAAKRMWEVREERFMPRARMSWEDGTELAKKLCLSDAEVAIETFLAVTGR